MKENENQPEPAVASSDLLDVARSTWNQMADEFNQWENLSQDERDSVLKVVHQGYHTAATSGIYFPPVYPICSDNHKFWSAGFQFYRASNAKADSSAVAD